MQMCNTSPRYLSINIPKTHTSIAFWWWPRWQLRLVDRQYPVTRVDWQDFQNRTSGGCYGHLWFKFRNLRWSFTLDGRRYTTADKRHLSASMAVASFKIVQGGRGRRDSAALWYYPLDVWLLLILWIFEACEHSFSKKNRLILQWNSYESNL